METKIKITIWDKLTMRTAPLLGGRNLAAMSDDELKVFAKSAEIPLATLHPLIQAERLVKQAGIDVAMAFGLIKANMGHDLNTLLVHTKVELRNALRSAIERHVIPERVGRQIDESVAHLDVLRYRYGSLQSTVRNLGIKLPVKLAESLATHGIKSLDDIRRAGGLGELKELPVSIDDPKVKALVAAAQFAVVSNEPAVGKALLRAGYTGLADVARSSSREFQRRVEKDLPALQAAALHDAAKMQAQIINNYVTGLRVLATAKGAMLPKKLGKHLPQTCHCCSDAASLIAYLADLLDYTVRHVKYDGAAVDLAFLESHLHQPFSGLPIVCEDDIEPVRQLRICIEVLRDMLPSPQKTDVPQRYLESVYRRLLELSGTSFDEIRAARVMSDSDRDKLAQRLQILINPNPTTPRPADKLDDLYRDPDASASNPLALSEAWLELWFGLRDTTRSPLDPPITMSRLLNERLKYWQQQWRIADSSDATSPLGAYPLIDPDIVGYADLADASTRNNNPANPTPKTTWTAADLLDDRTAWVNAVIGELNNYRDPTGPSPKTFSQMLVALGQPLTTPDVSVGVTADLFEHNNPTNDPLITLKPLIFQLQETQRGRDISGWLAQKHLSLEEFDLLSRMAELESQHLPITESEWRDFNSVIVQRAKKLELAAQWLIDERAANPQITLTSKHFRLRPISNDSDVWTPIPFRSDPAIRRRWENALRGRLDQEQALQDAANSAVDTVEHEFLEMLRDDRLLAAALLGLLGAGGGLLTPQRLMWFTNNLLIDGKTSACAMTTRIEQAIETVQGLLFGIRNGLLDDTLYDIDDTTFDNTWQWLGSYETWRAAMSVFLYPENVLRPTLRKETSQVFDDLVTEMREISRKIGRQDAERIAAKYSAYFRDVCSLSFVALGQSSGASYFDPVATSTSNTLPYYLLVARGGYTGRLYFCVQDSRPDRRLTSGFRRSIWNPIPDLAPTHHVTSVFPYQLLDGSKQIRLCATNSTASEPDIFLSFNGSHWTNNETQRPLLLNTCPRYDVIPASADLARAGTTAWTVRNSDHLVCLDVDGDGRKEILIVAGVPNSTGTRDIAIVRESDGGLVLSMIGNIAGDWDLPSGQTVVLRTTRRREQLLLIKKSGGNIQLGLLGKVNTTIGLVYVTATRTITQPGGPGSWTIDQNSRFVAADVDGDGFSELIAIDPMRTVTVPYPGGYNINVYQDINVLNVRETGFTWRYRLVHGRVNNVVPMQDSQSPGQVLLCVSPVTNHPEMANVSVLRWKPLLNKLEESSDRVAVLLANAPKPQGFDDPNALSATQWNFHLDDKWLIANLDKSKTGDELIVTNDSTADTVAISLGPPAPISVPAPGAPPPSPKAVSQFGITWRTARSIEPQHGASGKTWERQPGDRLIAADIDGDGRQEIIIFSPGAKDVGVLARTLSGAIEAFWAVKSSVPHAAEYSEPGWQAATDSRFVVGDIDGDGSEEVVALANGRLTIIRGYPPNKTALELGVKESPGTYGVMSFEIMAKDLAGWPSSRTTDIRNAYLINTNPDTPGLFYLDEAYYFLPIEIALRLFEGSNYSAALDWIRSVYDYEKPPADRVVAYKLTLDAGTPSFSKLADWLRDPLDPHAIASTRRLSYLKYTILVTVRCLLGYADSEFTYGTAESINRARELYLKALELLDTPEIMASSAPCDDLIGELQTTIGEGEWVWPDVRKMALRIADRDVLEKTLDNVRAIMKSSGTKPARFGAVLAALRATQEGSEARTIKSVMSSADRISSNLAGAVLADLPIPDALPSGAPSEMGGQFAAVPTPPAARILLRKAVPGSSGMAAISHKWGPKFVPAPSPVWCVLPNAQFDALRRHAEANLHKLRNCRNIAGMEVVFEAEAAPSANQLDLTDVENLGQLRALVQRRLPPLPYRYATLVERAKQLVELARQIEQSMLSSLQLADQKRFELLKARQDLALARSGVRLRDLQVIQAGDATRAAELQRDRAQLQVDEYDRRLQVGLTANELAGLAAQVTAAALYYVGGIASLNPSGVISGSAQSISTFGAFLSQSANYERRAEEWQFQARLSRQEVKIGSQQIQVAKDQQRVAAQERVIAGLQADHAGAILDFLTTGQFLNLDIYEWMSGVLEGIYRFFLQQATSLAQMAEAQLAFERQENPPTVIRDDYWIPPETGMSADFTPGTGQAPDVKGLTGSARLLRDVYELDQYAFTTNQRKLQLTETISLAQLDPIAFQQFRQTGVLVFETPMELFDRKFPGHYLRLIRRVRTSVVALVPASLGIRATLSSAGLSRVVIGPDLFQTATIRRPPESVALSSAWNATGLFELDVQPELLIPFEGYGVDTRWQLEMPKPANPFDYNSIADVMFTIEYTALNSYDYRQQVLQDLSRYVSADRAFSFRNDFADAWYELNNPDVCAPPAMSVSFSVDRSDFPPNLDASTLLIKHIALFFVLDEGSTLAVPVQELSLTPLAGAQISGGAATSDATGVISTRRGNAGSWNTLIQSWNTLIQQPSQNPPFPRWQLALTDSPALRARFSDGKIKDILFVLTYEAQTPQWPQ